MAELDDSPQANAESPSTTNTLSSVLGAAVMRRISLPKFLSVSGSVNSITIDQIRLDNTTVDRVDVLDVNTEVDTGPIEMENAQVLVRLALRFYFRIRIPLPWPIPDIDFGDSFSVGTITFPFDVGDISIPALNSIDLEIPSATLEDIQASLEPVNNLNLGGAAFNKLELDNTLLPTAGFGLSGMSLGAFSLTGLTMPSITSESLSVDGFSLNNALRLPSLTIEDIQLPVASAVEATTTGPVVVPNVTSETQRIPLTRGLLTTSLDISPTLTIAISSMAISNISAVSTIRKVEIHDVQSTVQVSGVTARGLELSSIELESLTTSA